MIIPKIYTYRNTYDILALDMTYDSIRLGAKKTGPQWVDVVKPTHRDHQRLLSDFPLLIEADVDDAISQTARNRILKRKEYIFFVLMVPVLNRQSREIDIEEIDFFLGNDFLITVHQGTIAPITNFFRDSKGQAPHVEKMLHQGSIEVLFHTILEDISNDIPPIMDNIDEKLRMVKEQIFKGKNSRKMVQEILFYRRNITDLRKAVRGHANILRHLVREDTVHDVYGIATKYRPRFAELVAYSEDTWGALESYKEIVEALQNANESLISHDANDTIKFLTAFSALLLPATLAAGLWGMNVAVPFADAPDAFYLVMAIGASSSLLLFVLFKRKHWFK